MIYKCERCDREFSRKHNYESHCNRKNKCEKKITMEYLLHRINELEEEINYIKYINKILEKNRENYGYKKEIKKIEYVKCPENS